MGRPLYSRSFVPVVPVVRSETPPPASHPPYEKWTYWNPFDPDSEEFFENDPVYEAFIDIPAISPAIIVPIIPGSPSTVSTPIDSGSPASARPDDPVSALPEVYPDYWPLRPQQLPRTTVPPDVLAPDLPSHYPSVTSVSPDPRPRPFPAATRPRSATVTVLPQRRYSYSYQNAFDGLPRTSNITPITIPARTTVTNIHSIPNSSTQSVTPRILNWTAALPPTNSSAASPPSLPAGPLTNPNARMSLAHITPTLIRVHDVTI